jgi:hypothetical protein
MTLGVPVPERPRYRRKTTVVPREPPREVVIRASVTAKGGGQRTATLATKKVTAKLNLTKMAKG